jgi:hypothetical protein
LANFIKYADKDSDAIHEMNDETSDFMIVFASKWYRDLGNSTSAEMNVFATWWALQHPGVHPTLAQASKTVSALRQFRTSLSPEKDHKTKPRHLHERAFSS